MNTIIIDGKRVAYNVEYRLNSAIVNIYVRHRRGQEAVIKNTKTFKAKDYTKASIKIDTRNCLTEEEVIRKAIHDIKIIIRVSEGNLDDPLFIKEIFKALE